MNKFSVIMALLHNSAEHRHFRPSSEFVRHTSNDSPPVYILIQSRTTLPSGRSILEQTHSFISETDLEISWGSFRCMAASLSMQFSTVNAVSAPTKHLKQNDLMIYYIIILKSIFFFAQNFCQTFE